MPFLTGKLALALIMLLHAITTMAPAPPVDAPVQVLRPTVVAAQEPPPPAVEAAEQPVVDDIPVPEVIDGVEQEPAGDSYTTPGPVEFTPNEPDPLDGVPASVVAIFDRIAQCESGGDWSISTGNGFYGGLQWVLSTWARVKAPGDPVNPRNATREQQIRAAAQLSAGGHYGAWPGCARQLGLRR